jgi:hypothetical protein
MLQPLDALHKHMAQVTGEPAACGSKTFNLLQQDMHH